MLRNSSGAERVHATFIGTANHPYDNAMKQVLMYAQSSQTTRIRSIQ
jgi:hypothetical protein